MEYLSYSKPCPLEKITDFFSSGYDYESPFDVDPPEDYEKRRKFKAKNWVFVSYPDDPLFESICLKVRFADCCFVISPLHTPEDEEKKQHFHFLIMFGNDRHFYAVCKMFDVAPHMLKKCSDPLAYIRYMVHLGYDKPQYDKAFIKTNNSSIVIRAFALDRGTDPMFGVQQIHDALLTIDFESEWDLERWCYENHLEGIYHHVRQSIHNSWDIIKRRYVARFVKSESINSAGRTERQEGDIPSWEQLQFGDDDNMHFK